MKKFFKSLRTQAETNPLLVIGVGVGVVIAVSKVVETVTAARDRRRKWSKKEVKRRLNIKK